MIVELDKTKTSFNLEELVNEVKDGKIELCIYYHNDDNQVKYGYMFKNINVQEEVKSNVCFATWKGFNIDNIDNSKSNNLDTLCMKTKKWLSEMRDKNAIETILSFMSGANWYDCDTKEESLIHVVENKIAKGIFKVKVI